MTGLAGDRESEEGRKAVRFGVLDTAILDNDLDLIKAVLGLGVEPWVAGPTVSKSFVNSVERRRPNLIQLAVCRRRLQALQILVAHTFSVLPRNRALQKILYPEEGLSLVLYAALHHDWKAPLRGSALEYLLDLGANINELATNAIRDIDWTATGCVGGGLLHLAVRHTDGLLNPEVIRALAKRGATLDLRAQPPRGPGCTALEIALRTGNLPAAQELVHLGASIDDLPSLVGLPVGSRGFVRALRAKRLLQLTRVEGGARKSRRATNSF